LATHLEAVDKALAVEKIAQRATEQELWASQELNATLNQELHVAQDSNVTLNEDLRLPETLLLLHNRTWHPKQLSLMNWSL
jgi:hypothetical protein